MIHFCQDEAAAVAAGVPFLGYFLHRLRHAWRRLWNKGRS